MHIDFYHDIFILDMPLLQKRLAGAIALDPQFSPSFMARIQAETLIKQHITHKYNVIMAIGIWYWPHQHSDRIIPNNQYNNGRPTCWSHRQSLQQAQAKK